MTKRSWNVYENKVDLRKTPKSNDTAILATSKKSFIVASLSFSFRVVMGLRPTHRNESQAFVTPAQAGVHVT
jgi:hypothetical protein